MWQALRATLIGGVFFLIPVGFLALILDKVFQISLKVFDPIDAVLPVKSVGGVALANLIAVLALVAICFLAGLAARLAVLAAYSRRIDAFLIELLPGYAVAKSMVGGVVQSEEALETLLPVLVRFNDYAALAFEVERSETAVAVFLPGAPGAWSGTSVLVDPARVTRLDLKPHEVAGKLSVLGRGAAQYASLGVEQPATEVEFSGKPGLG